MGNCLSPNSLLKPTIPINPSFTPQPQIQQEQVIAEPKFDTQQIQTFLNHIVWGRQDEAEAMLKINKELALASGHVTDHDKRTYRINVN